MLASSFSRKMLRCIVPLSLALLTLLLWSCGLQVCVDMQALAQEAWNENVRAACGLLKGHPCTLAGTSTSYSQFYGTLFLCMLASSRNQHSRFRPLEGEAIHRSRSGKATVTASRKTPENALIIWCSIQAALGQQLRDNSCFQSEHIVRHQGNGSWRRPGDEAGERRGVKAVNQH